MGQDGMMSTQGYDALPPELQQGLSQLGLSEQDLIHLADQRGESVADTTDWVLLRYTPRDPNE